MAAQSPELVQKIAADLQAVCSTPSHPEYQAALEFSKFLAIQTPAQLRSGRVDATALSDSALHFSVRLLQGALSPSGANH
jgi:hypothetical protein